MGRGRVILVWSFFALLFINHSNAIEQTIGVNWGTQATQVLDPTIVIKMLKDNGVKKIKLFDSDHWTVKHFAGTGLQVMLGIPNNQLKRFQDYDKAKDWVKKNVSSHLHDGGVNIKYVAVGNEPFLKAYNGSFEKIIFPALKNIQNALNRAGLGNKIKATIPQNADVYLSDSSAPSTGHFRNDIKDIMTRIVLFLKQNNAPFIVNIYPFLSLYDNPDFPINFAFFDGGAKPVVDKNRVYTNMYDANLDTLVYSLKKAGAPNMSIIVGEIGWPTDGNINANSKLARKFYDGFFKKVASDKRGNPDHAAPIEVYLFSLLDENLKSIAPGYFERHWGIFQYDGKPKFSVDFTGQGIDKFPISAKNVQYLQKQWCAFDSSKNLSDWSVITNLEFACQMGDCTSLGYGGTCNNLDKRGNISYAFNMYFQMQNQDVEACVFQGFAKIGQKNLSTSNCLFPIALESFGTRLRLGRALSILSGLLISITLF